MRIDERLGTFEEVAAQAEAHRATLEAVRAFVHDLHPDGIEVASHKEASVWWGVGPGKMRDGYAYVMPHARHVNLGFFQGVHLPDPGGLLEGTGKALRHVKLAAPEDLGMGVRTLVVEALAERKARA
ncbi:MAG: DUF1801 domain-containing protein [Shimia sp.]